MAGKNGKPGPVKKGWSGDKKCGGKTGKKGQIFGKGK